MALTDLLWSCPDCRELGALRPEGKKAARCAGCGTRYRRGRGASIVAEGSDGEERVLPAAGWVDRLPTIEAVVDRDGRVWYEERAEVRRATGTGPVRRRGEYIGRFERFGPARRGTISLEARILAFEDDDGAEDRWPLEELTAVQASSSTLQLKFRGEPVCSFRFPGGSVRFWELLLQHALRRHYRATGRGEIREFQPRIVTR